MGIMGLVGSCSVSPIKLVDEVNIKGHSGSKLCVIRCLKTTHTLCDSDWRFFFAGAMERLKLTKYVRQLD